MRLAHAALLASIPAVAFGARVIQQSGDAPPPPPPMPTTADLADAGIGDPLTVRGDRARARAFERALASVDAEVLLGDAVCTEEVVSSSPQTARYATGSRRYNNPDYTALAATQAEHSQALSALVSEQATLRASLQLHADREALQEDRIAHARRALRAAERELGDASAELSEAQTRLSRAHSAASAIEGYAHRRNALESQIRNLTRSISALEAELAQANAAREGYAAAAEKLAAAEARLAQATADAEAARAAMHAARDNPDLSDAERTAIRKQARDAKAALEVAQADVEAAERITARGDSSGHGHGSRHLGRMLRRQQAELASAEQERAALQPPSPHLHELADKAGKMEQRVRREASHVASAERDVADATQQLRIQQSRGDELARQRAEREATLSELIAQEESLRGELLSTEASMASMAPMRTRTLWDEVSYAIETRTRTCAVDATLLWPDGTFTQARSQIADTDTTHDAYAAANIAADALDYGRTDAERIAAADRDLIDQLRDAAGAAAVADAGAADTGW